MKNSFENSSEGRVGRSPETANECANYFWIIYCNI